VNNGCRIDWIYFLTLFVMLKIFWYFQRTGISVSRYIYDLFMVWVVDLFPVCLPKDDSIVWYFNVKLWKASLCKSTIFLSSSKKSITWKFWVFQNTRQILGNASKTPLFRHPKPITNHDIKPTETTVVVKMKTTCQVPLQNDISRIPQRELWLKQEEI